MLSMGRKSVHRKASTSAGWLKFAKKGLQHPPCQAHHHLHCSTPVRKAGNLLLQLPTPTWGTCRHPVAAATQAAPVIPSGLRASPQHCCCNASWDCVCCTLLFSHCLFPPTCFPHTWTHISMRDLLSEPHGLQAGTSLLCHPVHSAAGCCPAFLGRS